MPATRNIVDTIVTKKYPGLTVIAMCFEDACDDEDVPQAEVNALETLDTLAEAKEQGVISPNDIPLIFFRVRSPEQFLAFSKKLKEKHFAQFSGFIFPKFNSKNGNVYFDILSELNEKYGRTIYGMPILESREIALIETRKQELAVIKNIIDHYKKYVLNVRVGVTDFSATFGTRRGIDYTIYDILTVRSCLSAVLNTFNRDNDYVISGPVWEYFQMSQEKKFTDISNEKVQHSMFTKNPIINSAVDGLLHEVILDKANGFIGKTVIHPSHLRYVNAMQAVTREEYEDAVQILSTSGGVIKSANGNKMNEIKPHTNWAQRVVMKGKAYGVIEDESYYARLFWED
jgi:citrate lyase beta subunit